MVLAPADDDAVVPFWRDLGLPGMVDMHVHVMPQPLLDKVWAYFDPRVSLDAERLPPR